MSVLVIGAQELFTTSLAVALNYRGFAAQPTADRVSAVIGRGLSGDGGDDGDDGVQHDRGQG
jgi:hypothetical protein